MRIVIPGRVADMFLERRTVSRKTPADGRLEISSATAARMRAVPTALEIEYDGERAPGRIEQMECGCAKASGSHAHHFVVGGLLRQLEPATDVELHLEDSDDASTGRRRLVVRRIA